MAGVHLPRSTSSPTPWPLTCLCQVPAQPRGVAGDSWESWGAPTGRLEWVPVPVRRYPRVGNHDGLQVEAPVTQIPAGRRGRALALETAAPHPCVCWLPKLQHSGDARNPNSSVGPRGNRHSQGSLARQGWRGSKEGSHTSTGCLGAAPSQWLLLDVAASISNRISSQQLHFKAFHSAALME